MSEKKWENCPFCGCEDIEDEYVSVEGREDERQPLCSSCWATASREMWNKRTVNIEIVTELVEIADSLNEWVMAVPGDVVAKLPAMPGMDRDWVDGVLDRARLSIKKGK